MATLFGKSKDASLKERSKGVFNVFTKTIADLEKINLEIAAELSTKKETIALKEAEIEAIDADYISLDEAQLENAKIIGRIRDFFE